MITAVGWTKVDHWLSRMSPKTQYNCTQAIKNWMLWVGNSGTRFSRFTPDDLIKFQAETTNGDRFAILDEIVQPYVNSIGGRANTLIKTYSTIRSFFLHNRSELPKDPSFRFRPTIPKVVGTLKPEQIRDIVLGAKPLYQAIFMSIFQGALDLEGFSYWNAHGWDELNEQLDEEQKIIKISLPGRKARKNIEGYYSLIGADSIKAIKNYIDTERPQTGKAIFCNRFGQPISKNSLYLYWLRHLRKLGLVGPPVKGVKNFRSGLNPHELRDCFRTLWAKTPASPEIGEFLMGHQLDKLGYNKVDQDETYVKNQYKLALPWLNLLSSTRAYGLVSEEAITDLDEKSKEQDEKIESIMAYVHRLEALVVKQNKDTVEDSKLLLESGAVSDLNPQKELYEPENQKDEDVKENSVEAFKLPLAIEVSPQDLAKLKEKKRQLEADKMKREKKLEP